MQVESMIPYSNTKHIYFIGIGGIGMSAIARYFLSRGKKVSGYDKTETKLTQQLVSEGMNVAYDDDIYNLPGDVDLVIFTPAIPKDHKGYQYFLQSEIPMIKRAEALGLISNDMQAIGVAGTHGKTTTSSMISYLLKAGGKDISAFLGGIPTDFKTNYIIGSGNIVVLEADEYDMSFLHLTPWIATISSMDPDHLDIYGDNDRMVDGFKKYACKIC
jgi:UDP-N-acetylmuramate--alanine ligase